MGSTTGWTFPRSGAIHAGSFLYRRMKSSMLRSATAAMVCDGLVPVAAGNAAPSMT